VVGQGVRAGAGDVLVLEAADAVELRLVEPVEQVPEFRLGLAGVADDEGRAQREVGAGRAPAAISSSVSADFAGRAMRFSTSGWACWNGMSR
jgi:hypothetical protein